MLLPQKKQTGLHLLTTHKRMEPIDELAMNALKGGCSGELPEIAPWVDPVPVDDDDN